MKLDSIGHVRLAELRKRCLWYLGLRFVLANNDLLKVRLQDLQSDLYFAAAYRRIIDPLQIARYRTFHHNGEEVVACDFHFSPGYLDSNPALCFAGLRDIEWRFLMPKATSEKGLELHFDEGMYRRERTHALTRSWVEIIWLDERQRIDWQAVVESLGAPGVAPASKASRQG